MHAQQQAVVHHAKLLQQRTVCRQLVHQPAHIAQRHLIHCTAPHLTISQQPRTVSAALTPCWDRLKTFGMKTILQGCTFTAFPSSLLYRMTQRRLQASMGSSESHRSCQPSSSLILMSRSRSFRIMVGRGASLALVRPWVLPFRSYCLLMGSAF